MYGVHFLFSFIHHWTPRLILNLSYCGYATLNTTDSNFLDMYPEVGLLSQMIFLSFRLSNLHIVFHMDISSIALPIAKVPFTPQPSQHFLFSL